MSIYSSTVHFDGSDCGPGCPRWVDCDCADGHPNVMILGAGGHQRYDDTKPHRCGPIAYRASHVLPDDADARAGCFSLAEIPGHITRQGREERDEEAPWPWLRVSLNEGDAVLDRVQVAEVHAYLGDWLNRTKARGDA